MMQDAKAPTPMAGLTRQQIPNMLTNARVVLTVIFIALLAFYKVGHDRSWLLIAGLVLFIIAAITDFFDGYLARKWQVESAYGRVMDPVCDKVLVLGAYAMLAGPGFDIGNVQVSGVLPWMVVAMLGRELLVTALRGEIERHGQKFGAMMVGKVKTTVQLVAAPVLMFLILLGDINANAGDYAWVTFSLGLLVTIITLISGIPYLTAGVRILKQPG